MASYDLYQQVFTLSFISNVGDHAPAGSDLQQYVSTEVPAKVNAASNLIGTWNVVWGPVVYSSNDTVVDNAMYVAANSDSSVYVVAIAATNPASAFDTMTEDWGIQPPVAWPYSGDSTNKATIASGTYTGVKKLLAMADTSSGQTLIEFLQALPNQGSKTVIFTGHSLGGALAPTLAVALMNPKGSIGLSTDSWKAVYVYPTAGPTPGNGYFAQLYASVFPPVSGQQWNLLQWNTLDMVPHAWAYDMLAAIPNLYASNGLAATPCVNKLVSLAIQNAGGQPDPNSDPNLYFTQLQNTPLQGSFSTSPQALLQTCRFLEEAFYQHGTAYITLLNVPELVSQGIVGGGTLPPKACVLAGAVCVKNGVIPT